MKKWKCIQNFNNFNNDDFVCVVLIPLEAKL